MNNIEPKEKFVITHPREEDGTENKFAFMLTLGKKISHRFNPVSDAPSGGDPDTVETRLIRALGTLDGIDSINPGVGRYTITASIARTFDPDEVLNELKRRLEEEVLSEVVRPQLVTPQ